ncbi:hypothetical protein LaLC_57530 [Bacillus anthracis]|uniref:Uncharacterized protein n=2 Tax=Bacillus anthracis TaxID=1392 RepID=Q6EZW7_BACAN|nr:hypothetical protein BX_A0050 [Bacillus anthracis str. A2012]AAT28791.2 hypothetical protein GBAA_pXO1_0050 [Bacillus anthracis str. 'Ames Ancestor']ADK08085.1 hypothetical protein BACI_pCIXO100500 [Bacillus cereus biovar anthracis str. CI]BAR79017.1 hypothetical protein BASH2_pXO10046 [Bacillus anthracis]GAO68343.1 hypothetical protein BA5240_5593 [Bacillus anthracis]
MCLLLLAFVLRTISLKLPTGEMSMKNLSSLLNVKLFVSVVAETLWTGVSGIAVSAEYMSE